MASDDDERQMREWQVLYERLLHFVQQHGTQDWRRTTDCWIDDDNIGTRQHKIYVRNLGLLAPPIVKGLQQLLTNFPRWEIVVAISVPGPGDGWSDMGLYIRPHEIIDGLQRSYFPEPYRGFVYDGARPGTEND